MVKAGRTMKQAMDAGNYYEITAAGWGRCEFPACETPAEVLECAKVNATRGWFRPIPAGMVFTVIRIKSCTGGCRFVEACGTITA